MQTTCACLCILMETRELTGWGILELRGYRQIWTNPRTHTWFVCPGLVLPNVKHARHTLRRSNVLFFTEFLRIRTRNGLILLAPICPWKHRSYFTDFLYVNTTQNKKAKVKIEGESMLTACKWRHRCKPSPWTALKWRQDLREVSQRVTSLGLRDVASSVCSYLGRDTLTRHE